MKGYYDGNIIIFLCWFLLKWENRLKYIIICNMLYKKMARGRVIKILTKHSVGQTVLVFIGPNWINAAKFFLLGSVVLGTMWLATLLLTHHFLSQKTINLI